MIFLYTHAVNILTIGSTKQGGSARVAYALSDYLARGNHTSYFLGFDTSFYATDDSPVIQIIPDRYSSSLFPSHLFESGLIEGIAQTIIEKKIDVVHAHFGVGFGSSACFAKAIVQRKRVPVRVITTFHGTDILGFTSLANEIHLLKYIVPYICETSDAITFVSEDLKQQAKKHYGAVVSTGEVIGNGVNTTMFSPGLSEEKKKQQIVHLSNFRPVKQSFMVVEVFASLLSQYPDATLLMVGDGPEREQVERLCEKYGISSSVIFTGSIPPEQVVIALRASSFLLVTSRYESFSLSALESMACGIPVVSLDVGGIGSVVMHRKTGILVSEENAIENLTRACDSLLSNKKQIEAYGRAGRERALLFSDEILHERYLSLYTKR